MYKIDDEFRPRGRVFMKATRESPTSSAGGGVNVLPVPARKSSLKKGPPITTNLDDRNIQFEHEVMHEKSIEALITEYPSTLRGRGETATPAQAVAHYETFGGAAANFDTVPDHHTTAMETITRNKRSSTEILGSSFESKKLSQRAADGHRRITTHIVRKVTTLSRAEENAHAQNMIKTAQNKTTEMGYMTTHAIEPAPKVFVMLRYATLRYVPLECFLHS